MNARDKNSTEPPVVASTRADAAAPSVRAEPVEAPTTMTSAHTPSPGLTVRGFTPPLRQQFQRRIRQPTGKRLVMRATLAPGGIHFVKKSSGHTPLLAVFVTASSNWLLSSSTRAFQQTLARAVPKSGYRVLEPLPTARMRGRAPRWRPIGLPVHAMRCGGARYFCDANTYVPLT